MKEPDSKEIKKPMEQIEELQAGEFDDSYAEEFEESGFAEWIGHVMAELEDNYEFSSEEIYEEIVDNFFCLFKEIGVSKFEMFRFVDYDYPREVIIDGKKYDFDCEIDHDESDALEALCAIDCLIADLENEGFDNTLQTIEEYINQRNNTAT